MNSTKPSTAETPVAEQKRGTKHKLTPGKGGTPSKKQKKVHNSVLNSVRSRHLKKFDGQPFWRKDIQYSLLKSLFDNDIKAFTDPFPDSDENVSMDDRELDPRGRLSFAELYIKSIAHSSKCSKVLKDRLLNDMKMSIPTCMICLLVNVGRMNTTINFVPDMKSQLRTYHPIPSLQSNDKQLQDTPRLKSILKACCDDSHEPSTLDALMKRKALPLTTCVNMIFVLCNYEDLVQSEFFEDVNYNFYDIFMNASYNPRSRADLFLWLLWNYLESHRTPEEISKNPFGSEKPLLKPAVMEFDVDTPLEKEFGEKLYEQRIKYLSE
ncbi:Ies1p CYBJADRAFT_122071, partial [Cyberlindnera jadinii NRRL Y-1542]